MKRPNEIDDDDDNPFDSRGCLKDGRKFTVSMQMRDQRTVATDVAIPLHRPGYRYPSQPLADSYAAGIAAAQAHNRIKSYFDHEIAEQSRWKGGPKAGDPCTVDGKHGRLVEENGELVFSPHTDESIRADRARAYDEAASQEATHPAFVGFGSSGQGANYMKQPPGKELCVECNGTGTNNSGVLCHNCAGTGYAAAAEILRSRADARDKAYALADLVDQMAWQRK